MEAFEQDISDRMNVPTSLLDEYYELRLHTALTLERLQARKSEGVGPEQGSASEDDPSPDDY